jgi:SNF2 family DNA or RNA helicase
LGGVKGLSNELMQLRRICQHPLFESVEDKVNPTGYVNDKLIRTSGKIELLSRVLPKNLPLASGYFFGDKEENVARFLHRI